MDAAHAMLDEALLLLRDLLAAGARFLAAAVVIARQRIASAWAATCMAYEHTLRLARAKVGTRWPTRYLSWL